MRYGYEAKKGTVRRQEYHRCKIASIRKARHIKQKDFLARLQTLGMDVSATSLSRLEGEHRLVQDYEVVILAKALDIPVEELLGTTLDQ